MTMKQASRTLVITQGHESPTLLLGPQRLHYIYSESVPQIHLNLVAILQGIAFGVLILNIPVPKDFAWPGVLDFALKHYLYLPFITSSLIVLLAWNQYVYGAVVFIWPMSLIQSGLIFMLAVTETITFASIASLPAWLVLSGLLFFVGGLHRINNVRYHIRDQSLSPQFASALEGSQWRDGGTYVLVGGLLIAAGLTYTNVISALQSMNVQLAELYPWALNVSYLVITIASCVVFVRLRQHQLAMAVEGSDLVVLPHGQIVYAGAVADDKSLSENA
jgi:energy-converting hydrogenase Eha subunit C